MEYNYPKFTPEMKKTHTILIPNMAVTQFRLMEYALRCEGYKCELLGNCGSAVAQLGLKYVHNDTCYPALLVIGQFLDALNSGKYDLEHTALLITQPGGGCRAANYIYLLRKGMEKAGLGNVPIISLNVNGMNEQPGFELNLAMIKKFMAAIIYGDTLMYLANKTRPYETIKGAVDELAGKWLNKLETAFMEGKAQATGTMKQLSRALAEDFAALPQKAEHKIKVGIVGEIYNKYAGLGNNNLEQFLQKQNCEYMLPGLLNFIMYCADTYLTDYKLYGGKFFKYGISKMAMFYLKRLEKIMLSALSTPPFKPPASYEETKALAKDVIGYSNNIGEGWHLTAEMLELAKNGYNNIICAQPFGCLPNHIAGRGMLNKIKGIAENANILPIDYDSSASKVNQETRIKLMLATAE